jgi:nicotinamidase-related amidase
MIWGNTALIVIDVQIGLFKRQTSIYKEQELLENINKLEIHARSINIPIIYIQHANDSTLVEGSDEWQLHPQLYKRDYDLLIQKRHPNTFKETNFQKELQERNISQLVIVGTLTDNCVSATCIGAIKLGYKVILATDAHSTFSDPASDIIEEWHDELKNLGITLKSTKELLKLS